MENEFKEGDRVYTYDSFEPGKFYGTIFKNTEYPNVSEWYIKYDNGDEFSVLDLEQVFKD